MPVTRGKHRSITPAVSRLAETPNELCTYCGTLTRIEAERGFILLEAYLRKWAAFQRWLEAQAAPAV